MALSVAFAHKVRPCLDDVLGRHFRGGMDVVIVVLYIMLLLLKVAFFVCVSSQELALSPMAFLMVTAAFFAITA